MRELMLLDLLYDGGFYNYKRAVRDKRPYEIKNYDDKATIVHNILGLGKDDIKLEIKPLSQNTSYLIITGKKKDEVLESDYSVKSRFEVNHNNVDRIEKKCENGVLYIDVFWKKKEVPNIEIIDK